MEGYRQEGYDLGFRDGQRTGGRINKIYTDALFAGRKNNLSPEESRAFITGWHDGFTDGVAEIVKRMVCEEGLVTQYFQDFKL